MSIREGSGQVRSLTRLAASVREACATLAAFVAARRSERKALAAELRRILGEADSESRLLLSAVGRSFVTPIDRVVLADLATKLPDIVERLSGVADLAHGHRLGDLPPDVIGSVAFLERGAELIDHGVHQFGRPDRLLETQHELRRLMREVRRNLRHGITESTASTPDSRSAMRDRDVLIQLVRAVEAFDAVTDLLRTVAIQES
ncbi:MAG TPA: hypothetical protein VFC82_09345 [Actinomycetaceae bacterium]|nr:hypothetical protein [Actinomycetaceae bacterium]